MIDLLPVRFSRLKKMALSPKHYVSACAEEFEQTREMRIGTAVHRLVTGVGGQPVVYEGTRRGKAWDAFKAEHADKLIVNTTEWDTIQRCAESVHAHPKARALLQAGGSIEREMEWTVFGLPARGTPDQFNENFILDLKTTKFAQPQAFKRDAARRAYHAQLDWYATGVEKALGFRPEEAVIIAVETNPPYLTTVVRCSDEILKEGRRLWENWFVRLQECMASGEYGGYNEEDNWWYPDTPGDLDLSGLTEEEEAAQ